MIVQTVDPRLVYPFDPGERVLIIDGVTRTDPTGRAWDRWRDGWARRCAFCGETITAGWHTRAVGWVCADHLYPQHWSEREGTDHELDPGNADGDLVPDRRGEPIQPVATDRRAVPEQQGSGLTCPKCGARIVVTPDGHHFCPACPRWFEPLDGGHSPIIHQPERGGSHE